MKFSKKLAILWKTKRISGKLIYNTISKCWKKDKTKEGFNCIFNQVLLIGSVY